MKIIIPIYTPLRKRNKKTKKMEDKDTLVGMNNYRNWHFQVSNEIKIKYYDLIKEQIQEGIKFKKIKPSYKLYIKNKTTDGGNVVSIMEKFTLDTLVGEKVIPNDTYDIVVGSDSEYFLDKENPRIEITIEEIKK